MADQKSKTRSITRTFIADDGEETSRATNDCKAVKLAYTDGTSHTLELAEVFGGSLPPPCVGRAACAFGLSTSLGNAGNTASYQKAKELDGGDVDPSVIWEAVDERLKTLKSGEWAEQREGVGPSPTLMVEAFKVFRTEVVGKPVVDASGNVIDQARIDDFKAKIADKTAKERY